jgi:hypothetical protein
LTGTAHESTAGLAVGVVPPAVAVRAVNAGILNQLLAQAAGAVVFIVMLLVSVTTRVELGATISGVVSVWEVPEVAVEYRQVTEAVQAFVVVNADVVYPAANTVFAGRLRAVMVTGTVPELTMLMTASP